MQEYKDGLAKFKDLRILVIGDAMLDEYIHTTVDRISAEAPVQVAKVREKSYVLGGAANVAHNLADLGASVDMICVIGKDEEGTRLRQELAEHGISTDGVFVDRARPTTTKTRIIAEGQQMIRLDNELAHPISAELEDNVLLLAKSRLSSCGVVIVSDYSKGLLTEKVVQGLVNSSRQNNKSMIADPKGRSFKKYAGVKVIAPNAKEAETVYGKRLVTEQDFKRAGRFLLEQVECEAVLITRGKDGMSLYRTNHEYDHICAEAKEVYDVTGAGDTAISMFGLAVLCGYSYLDAARLANIAAGIVVGKRGTATVCVGEVVDYIDDRANVFLGKIKNLEQLRAILARKKEQGKIIVFTNGCFDLLHIGHIQLLQRAKNLGDELVVALNSDSSTRALKGPGRPIISELERAHIMSALSCVDHVLIFSEPTPERVIKRLEPHILVKGADYEPEKVVGREIVEGYGGRVELIPLIQGKSTSSLVQNIRGLSLLSEQERR